MISLSAGIKSFDVNFTPSNELDIEWYTIHAVHENDPAFVAGNFVPTASNQINRGRESSYHHVVTTGGTWYVKVAAIDSWENLDAIDYSSLNYSAVQSIAVPTLDPLDTVAPGVPALPVLTTAVDVTGQSDVSRIVATWTANTDSDLAGYIIQIKKGSNNDYVEYTVGVKATSVTHAFEGLVPGTSYSCRVAAYDKWSNTSAFTAWATVTTAASTAVPAAPSYITVSSGIGTLSITIAGTKSANWKEFKIEVAPTAGFTTTPYSSSTVSDINSFKVAAGTYYVRAKSISRSGISSSWTTSTAVVVNSNTTQILSDIAGQLTTSQLHSTLTSRIDLIDAAGTGLVQQITNTNGNLTALQTQVNSLTVAPYNTTTNYAVGNLVSYTSNTYKCILAATAPAALPTNTTYWELSSNSTSLAALIAEEQELRIGQDTAIANAINLTSTTLNGQTTAISVQATSIDGLKGQYSVKIDSNDRVVGFGLSSGSPNQADSEFIIIADKFMVVEPTVNGGTPKIPFSVGTVDGQPAVVIPKAFIADASINTAKIETLDVGSVKVTGTISADRIAANSISTAKLEIGTMTLANETWQGVSPLTNWVNEGPTADLSVVAGIDGVMGSNFLRVGNALGNDQAWMVGTQNIPFDPTRLYKLKARVRRTSGTGSFYVGWMGILADGVTYVNANGATGASGQISGHYHAANGASPAATWTVYEGYTKGSGVTIGTSGLGSLVTPGLMHPNVKFIRPMFVANYANATGIIEVDSIVAEWVPVVLAPEYFENGTFAKTLSVGDSKVKLDGVNKRITINDGTRDRVKLGNLGSSYGLEILNDEGLPILTSNGDVDGLRVKNLTVNGNAVIAGAVTIGGASISYTDGATLQSLRPAAAGATANAFRGAWSAASVDYILGDEVLLNGSTWGCILAHTSIAAKTPPTLPTTSNTYWTLRAAKGDTGPNGTRTAILDMYQWAPAAPTTFPTGTSTYTWATGQFTAPATANSWTLTPLAAVVGQTLWIARTIFADSLTTATSSITWAATSAKPVGGAGTNGTRAAFLELFKWDYNPPVSFPSGSSTYTWATGAFTAPTPLNSWALTPGASTPGQNLYGCSVTFADTLTTSTSSVPWNTSTAYVVGAAGWNGAQGPQGIAGPTGANGVTTYTWIKYGTSAAGAGLSDDPTGKTYIGFAYNKPQAAESVVATDYTWSLIQGATGNTGATGPTGANGVTYYTWVKYSDVSDGTGLYDTPTASTKYIGIAVNQPQAAESAVKTDYTWSLFKGDTGATGPTGANAITVVVSNESHSVPCDLNGAPTSYAGSGSDIYVYDNGTALTYVTGSGTPAGTSQFTVVAGTGGGILSGAISAGTGKAVVAPSSGMTSGLATTSATITYTIVAKKADGAAVTVTKVRSFSKSIAGATGAAGPVISITASKQVVSFTDNVLDAGQTSITFAVTKQSNAGAVTWLATDETGTTRSVLTSTSDTAGTLTIANFGTTYKQITVKVTAGGVSDVVTVIKVNKSTAAAGADITSAALAQGVMSIGAALNVRNFIEVGPGVAGAVTAGISAVDDLAGDYNLRFWAGKPFGERYASSFQVNQGGKLKCTGADIRGTLNASDITAGTLSVDVINSGDITALAYGSASSVTILMATIVQPILTATALTNPEGRPAQVSVSATCTRTSGASGGEIELRIYRTVSGAKVFVGTARQELHLPTYKRQTITLICADAGPTAGTAVYSVELTKPNTFDMHVDTAYVSASCGKK